MALTFTYTPNKDFYDSEGTFVFNSKWLAAFNPIVFKVQSDLFPTNSSDTPDTFTSVETDGGRARLVLDTVDDTVHDASIYVRGAQITVSGSVYDGVYTILKYDPINAKVTIDATYTATDTGSILRYYTNYVAKLLVSAGLPSTHKWQALKPMIEIETLTQRPNDDGEAVFDVSKSVQQRISTTNNIRLISLPNDINLWTAYEVEAHQEYLWFAGTDLTIQETVSSTQSNGGYIELVIPSPNDFNVGDWVKLTSTTDSASDAVVRIISKNTTTGDITIDCDYDAYIDITIVTKYDLTRTVLDSGYNTEGNTYYAHNAKQGFNRYGSNLAPLVNVEGNSDLANNLTDFDSMGKFTGLFSDFTSIMDKSMMDGLASNELPALEVTQYDQNGTELSTDYFTVTNQDEGVYRWLYTGGLTQSTLHSLNYQNENTSQVIAVTGEFIEMQVSTPFNQMLLANLTYQYNTTNSWGSPIISTTSLATFNAGMSGRPTGYIRITTSQTSFVEGGLIVQIDYVGYETDTTAITVVMPANRLDQDIVFYCQNFQFTAITSSQTGTQYHWGVRTDDYAAVDWTSFSAATALTNLTALNASSGTSAFKAVHLWFTEGTANTATSTKTISITGSFTDSRARGYVTLLDRQNNRTFRTALANNGKIYDGVIDSDVIQGWTQFEYTQPITVILSLFYTANATRQTVFHTNDTLDKRLVLIIEPDNTILVSFINTDGIYRANKRTTLKIKNGYNIIMFTWNGSGTPSGINIYINGVLSSALSESNTLGGLTIINPNNKLTIGKEQTTLYFIGRIRKFEILNRVVTSAEIRQAFLKGSLNGIAVNSDFLLDVDFNQTGTNESTISNGTYVYGSILSVANNGSGNPRFTVNGTTTKSPINGATVIISGTTSYNTASTGATITRISDTQFDITSIAYVANETGTFKVRITATGGAAYTTFMP